MTKNINNGENSTTETKNEKQITDEIFKNIKLFEDASQEQRSEIIDIYNAYMGKMDSVVSIPYDKPETIPKLRTEIAYVKPFIFSGEPEIEITGIGAEDEVLSKIYEKMVNFRLQQSIPDAYGKIEDWVHQATTFGTSIIRPVWKFETQKIKDESGEYEKPVKDEPDLEIPNILDCYYNPLIGEVEQQPCMIFRSVAHIDDIKSNPAYQNTDQVEAKNTIQQQEYNSTAQAQSELANALNAQKGMVEIYEMVTKDKITTVADGKTRVLLRDEPHTYGFINAVKFTFEKNTIPNMFNGLGVGHNTLGLGKLYHKMFNQTLANVKLTNNPMFNYKKGSTIDPRQFVAKPGGGIGSDDPGKDLVPILFPDIKQGAVEILTKIEDEHKRASGANDLVQGSASNDTLGQDEIAQANISSRFELIQRRFKHALAQVAEMILKMELENLQTPDSDIMRIFPEEMRMQVFQAIKQDTDIKYNIKVRGDSIIVRNKKKESENMIDIFNLSQNFLTDKEKRAFIRRIAEKQGEQNIDDLVMEVNPIMEQQEQMDAQMQQQQAMMPNQQMA